MSQLTSSLICPSWSLFSSIHNRACRPASQDSGHRVAVWRPGVDGELAQFSFPTHWQGSLFDVRLCCVAGLQGPAGRLMAAEEAGACDMEAFIRWTTLDHSSVWSDPTILSRCPLPCGLGGKGASARLLALTGASHWPGPRACGQALCRVRMQSRGGGGCSYRFRLLVLCSCARGWELASD